MGKILDYIADETQGKRFASFKYCYDDTSGPNIEYDPAEEHYINMKEYAESVHDPKMRDMTARAELCSQGPPLFKFFLDGSRKVYKVDDIQYDKKVFPVISGQVSVACCGRDMKDDYTFHSFHHIAKEWPRIKYLMLNYIFICKWSYNLSFSNSPLGNSN